ncbi:hypothetical protein D3876_18640 [Sphingomonas cavernae]|uniref:Uncharacterized protein n=1 Tax=Sphingomonas cavernae TaxID=2320861 RepID=A0A418W7H9_9SPHN|nr:hypothetical protein D3876_18640 [Sphingomonas cavernae]
MWPLFEGRAGARASGDRRYFFDLEAEARGPIEAVSAEGHEVSRVEIIRSISCAILIERFDQGRPVRMVWAACQAPGL